jgi:hypothetical protein
MVALVAQPTTGSGGNSNNTASPKPNKMGMMKSNKKGMKRKREQEMSPKVRKSKIPSKEALPIIDGMSSAEVMMIRKLAGNDPMVRKKTVRKLRKWLTALAQRTPDTPGMTMTSWSKVVDRRI